MTTALALLVSTALYTGFQWTIRVVVYPQFATVPPEAFVRFEARHQRLVSVAVGPLFLASGLAALVALARPPAGVGRLLPLATAAAVGAILLVTALLAVPLHRALSDGYDAAVHRRLLRVDTARLLLAVLATAGALATVVLAE